MPFFVTLFNTPTGYHTPKLSSCLCVQFNVGKALWQCVVCNDERYAGFASNVKALVDVTSGSLVDVTAYLIEYQNVCTALEGSGKSNFLLLAAREIRTAVKYLSIQRLICKNGLQNRFILKLEFRVMGPFAVKE